MKLFADFPTHPDIRLASIDGVEGAFDYAVIKGDALFTAIIHEVDPCGLSFKPP